MCCAEALLLTDPTDRIESRYNQCVNLYQKRQESEIARVKNCFARNGPETTISIIMPTYNRTHSLKIAIQSVLDQSYQQFELIVVNDGGTRDCEKIIRSFKSDKIRYLYVKHGGLSHALNQGILSSRSTYISYLDDDDRYFPDHLETLVYCLQQSGYPLVYSDGYRVTDRGKDPHPEEDLKEVPYSVDFNPGELSQWNYIPILCIAHRRGCFERTGLFENALPNMMDWDLWVRFSRHFDFKHIKKISCEYELWHSTESLSGNRVRHLFYEALLETHFKFQAGKRWSELIKNRNAVPYEKMEESIDRYTHDGYQLGVWLLPVALSEKKWTRAYRLIGRMVEQGSLKNIFLSIFKLFPGISFPGFIFLKIVIFFQLGKRLVRYINRKITFKHD